MIILRKHVFRTRRGHAGRRGRRGSVIVLVVAVLALLAVIGTIYVVSSRAERSSASTASTAENLENAQDAVNAMVVNAISKSMYDATGIVGGLNASSPLQGFPLLGYQAARRWDIPEIGIFQYTNPIFPAGSGDYNPNYRDQAWLVDNLYRNAYWPGYPVAPSDFAALRDFSLLTPYAFNPLTGQYNDPSPNNRIAYSNVLNNRPDQFNPQIGLFNVVSDPLPAGFDTAGVTSGAPVGGDALIQLLPYSDAGGLRYRFGVRILDTSRMLNLNVGTAIDVNIAKNSALLAYFLNNGTLQDSYYLANVNSGLGTFNLGDAPTNLDVNARFGNYGGIRTAYANGNWLQVWSYWQQVRMRMDDPTAMASIGARTFDPVDELELRAYGDAGTPYVPEAAPIWGNTFRNSYYGNSLLARGVVNTLRGDYTAYSYSRELRPPQSASFNFDPVYALPYAYTITPKNAPPNVIWPVFPARVGVNHDFTGYTSAAAIDQLAADATNIASAMEFVNGGGANAFSTDESRSFAANYLTYRWSTWSANGGVYSTAGPSAVDTGGILVRDFGVPVPYGSATDLNSTIPNLIYVGYCAQPFINELVIRYEEIPPASGKIVPTDYAAELYNPYGVTLNLTGYRIRCGGKDVLLDGMTIKPNGFIVVTMTTGKLDSTVDSSVTPKADGNLDFSGGPYVYLMRSYTTRSGAVLPVAVDQYNNTVLTTPPSAATDRFIARNNFDGTINTNRWAAAVESSASEGNATDVPSDGSATSKTALSLGILNKYVSSDTSNFAPPLYDRVIDRGDVVFDNLVFLNVADFNRVMRISNQVDASAGTPMNRLTISRQLRDFCDESGATSFTVDAHVHFDFRATPNLYMANGTPPTAYKSGDIRAVSLLECLSFTDRVTDLTIDLGDNKTPAMSSGVPLVVNQQTVMNRGISKLRVPGHINVNTASPEVLLAIPILAQNPQFVSAILAYRWRTTNDGDPRIPPNLQRTSLAGAPLYDFRNSGNSNQSLNGQFPGYGIRSLAELEVPLSIFDYPEDGMAPSTIPTGLLYSGAKIKTLSDRDQVWAAVYNYLTVRSDTFVVYAYLEAVRQNPRYLGVFDNKLFWYQNSPTYITDDPTDRSHPLLRVGRKRWIALVDRSQANYNYFVPMSITPDPRFAPARIVASKDLPQ